MLQPPLRRPRPAELWHDGPPQRGDHIRASRGLYTHHGVYVSDGEVIHFSSRRGEPNHVISTDLAFFCQGHRLSVRDYTEEERRDLYPVADIVQWARHCLGDGDYHLIFNNCEHFANVCTLGRFRSGQVERVIRGDSDMSIFGRIKDFFFGSSSSGSSGRSSRSTTTTYEPDRVKVAEIESQTKIKLAQMEQERVVLWKESQLELLEMNARMEAAMLEAKVRGFHALQKELVAMVRELNVAAEQRLHLIEKGSLEVVRQIDAHYAQLATALEAHHTEYMTEKLPLLLEKLTAYEPESVGFRMYEKAVEQDQVRHLEMQRIQFQQMQQRQNQLIESSLADKSRLQAHIDQLVEQRVLQLETSLNQQFAPPPALMGAPAPLSLPRESADTLREEIAARTHEGSS